VFALYHETFAFRVPARVAIYVCIYIGKTAGLPMENVAFIRDRIPTG